MRLFPAFLSKRKKPLLPLFLILAVCFSCFLLFRLQVPENRKFEQFSRKVFRAELMGNTLNLHYTLSDPSIWDLEDCEATLGSYDPARLKKGYAAAENYLNTLHRFSFEKLTGRQQRTWQIFEHYLKNELSVSDLILYQEPLSPTIGVQAQLPVLLAEYRFRTQKDIEDYLQLLGQVPDYLSSILVFEQAKSANGLFMSKSCAQEVVAQCETFLRSSEENYLIKLFNEKTSSISNLSADTIISYQQQNQNLVLSQVLPAYQQLADGLRALEDTGKNSMGLYYLPDGTRYYEYLIRSEVGDDRPVEEIETAVKKQILQDYAAISELLSSKEEPLLQKTLAVSEPSSALSSPDPFALLEDLRKKTASDFPALPDVSCQVKYVPKSLQAYASPAFYLSPSIDDYKNNVIYLNTSCRYDSLSLYTTLAHEGYPGHLFQTVYFNSTSPDLLRNLLGCGGYTEGWATYVELYSYSFWDTDPKAAALASHNRSFLLGIASLLDIGIHYHGYTLPQVCDFLTKLGFDETGAKNLYQTILETPANYLQYYVGYLNFCDLKKETQKRMGSDFTLKKFHTLILDAGPAPFSLLRTYVIANLS